MIDIPFLLTLLNKSNAEYTNVMKVPIKIAYIVIPASCSFVAVKIGSRKIINTETVMLINK